MADLTTLIRLHRHELDEKRRALGVLYSGMAELERQRRDLEREFEREKDAVSSGVGEVHYTFALYAEDVQNRRKAIGRAEDALDKQIAAARESMLETFSELKKYETTQEERDRIEEEERRFRENKEMDDIGIEAFRRKAQEE